MSVVSVVEPSSLWRRWEMPTWLVWLAVHLGFVVVTWFYPALPWWLVLPLGGWFVCWHSQLQHECLHGHPTRRPWFNALLVLPSAWLWLPYPIYRDSHIAHHRTGELTCPVTDPESFYLTRAHWAALPPPARLLARAHNTLAGRMVLGPPYLVARFLWQEIRRLGGGDASHLGAWLLHALAMLPLLWWVIAVCGIPFWAYVLLFAWPGTSLALLRSFHEHRPVPEPAYRSAIVERPGPLGLLFLNNNLHSLHHEQPDLAWYDLPRVYRRERERLLAQNGGYFWRGYAGIAARYLFRAKDCPLHPLS